MPQQSKDYAWRRYPEAASWLAGLLTEYVASFPWVQAFENALLARTGSRLIDWVDHLVLTGGERQVAQLQDLGFEIEEAPSPAQVTVHTHPGATFPRVLLHGGSLAAPGTVLGVAIRVEEIKDFVMAHHLPATIEGSPFSPYRRSRVLEVRDRWLAVVERRGTRGFVPQEMPPDYAQGYIRAVERWSTRPRQFEDDRQGMEHALTLARSMAGDLGAGAAAWIAFSCERQHWQQRNRAGQVQRARQDRLGLGWANHDHHTFRSSRDSFPLLIQILETFGFERREGFYAGAEAGWGAQVMEQPACGLTVFADVDLSPDEAAGDLAGRRLPPTDHLGTVGLWCALHGQAMLGAGLHHLAARFDFQAATTGLAEWGIGMMRPFSEFPYLKQAFTQGERLPVDSERVARLASAGAISDVQAAQFTERGAIGSHLENIQRGEGFKGFNQTTISDIIRRTDPRR